MSSVQEPHLHLEVGHILFLDIVGYSKRLADEQKELIQELNRIVRETKQFQAAEAEGKLTRLPTGDGMVLVFTNNPEAPVECALEISQKLQGRPQLKLRMGIHSGPVNPVADVNDQANLAGAGINVAQRVMSCGDAGHILLSKHFAEDLEHYAHWRSHLHNVGEVQTKHGAKIQLVNLYTDELGNAALPAKLKQARTAFRLKSVAVAGLLLIAMLGVGFWTVRRSQEKFLNTTAAIPSRSIAVLPLENLSEEKANAYFADGIQDELLSNLAKIKDLKVISRTSVMQYKSGITRNLKEIAQQLGVSYVVEGSVRRSGNRIRVSVQLINALTDHHLWVQDYDRTLADSITLQDELAREIAGALGATLSPQEKARVEAKPTNNPAAYDAYLRGRAFEGGSLFDKPTVENAIRSYQEAVKLDPTFVLAWARLSCAQSLSYWGQDPSPAQLAAAKDSADHALALDPNLPETHLALGYYRYYGQRDYTGGLAEFQQAEKGLPNNADITNAIALIQRRLGHWEEAIDRFRRVIELDPRNTNTYINLATTYITLRRFPEALATLDRVLAWEPTNADALGMKAQALWEMGDLQAVEPLLANPGTEPFIRGNQAMFQRRYATAIEMFSSAVAADTKRGESSKEEKFNLAVSQQRAGDVAAARATYQSLVDDLQRDLEKTAPDSYATAGIHALLGHAYAHLGEAASAIVEGQKAMAIHPTSKDPYNGPGMEENMARIYALLGDADHAIPILKRLLQIPYYGIPYFGAITPALLRLDPDWDQIRNDPRFQELAAEKKP
jgi:TolB-like protein/Tfp pilus assembly protein PilF